jgi:hypothetical protein
MKTFVAIVALAALSKGDHIGGEQDGQQDAFTAQGICKLAAWLAVVALVIFAVPWLL